MIDEKEKQLEKLKKLLVSEGLSIKVDIDTEKNVDKYFDVLREKYADFLKFKRTMENALVDNNNDLELFGLFGDNINKDAEDFQKAYDNIRLFMPVIWRMYFSLFRLNFWERK